MAPQVGLEPTTLRLTAAALRHVSPAMVSYPVGTSAAQILRKSCRVVSFGIALGTKLGTDDWGEPVC